MNNHILENSIKDINKIIRRFSRCDEEVQKCVENQDYSMAYLISSCIESAIKFKSTMVVLSELIKEESKEVNNKCQ